MDKSHPDPKSYDILREHARSNEDFGYRFAQIDSFVRNKSLEGYVRAMDLLNDAIIDTFEPKRVVAALHDYHDIIKASYAKMAAVESVRLYDSGDVDSAREHARIALDFAGSPPEFFVDDGSLAGRVRRILEE